MNGQAKGYGFVTLNNEHQILAAGFPENPDEELNRDREHAENAFREYLLNSWRLIQVNQRVPSQCLFMIEFDDPQMPKDLRRRKLSRIARRIEQLMARDECRAVMATTLWRVAEAKRNNEDIFSTKYIYKGNDCGMDHILSKDEREIIPMRKMPRMK